MEKISPTGDRKIMRRSWLIVVGIAVAFLCWGLFIFFAVGDKGVPPWDFGVIPDIPGESPYSTFGAKQFRQLEPRGREGQVLVVPQHVMEPKEEPMDTGKGKQ
jgi:hypothetical protein